MENKDSKAVKNGDEKAFSEFYQKNWKHVYLSTRNLVKSNELSKDLVQESFIKLWQSRATLDETADMLPLLYTIIRNRFINHLKREEIWKSKQNELSHQNPDSAITPYEELLAKEIGFEIGRVEEGMPAGMQKVWKLNRHNHLTVPEIAEALEISPLTVKKQLSRALKLLRQQFVNWH